MSTGPSARRLAGALEVAAAVLAGAAIAAASAGPIRLALGDATLSVRTLARPLGLGAAVLLLRVWLARRELVVVPAIAGRIGLGAIVTASVLGWTIFLSPTVGGVDSYGYVSTAASLLRGSLIEHEPLAAAMPFPNGIAAATPLGHVPSTRIADASVPLYPVGLPAVMAIAQAVGGASAPFWIAPIAGLLLVATSAVLARAWSGNRPTSLVAAALMAANPLVFTYAIQPMSDVPAAAALVAAIAALSLDRPRPLLAGLCAALAILIRPALAPATIAIPAVIGWSWIGRSRDQIGRSQDRPLQVYLIPLMIGVALLAWSQWYLYGDPLRAGYGRVTSLFSWETAATNLAIFGRWTVPTFGLVWLAAVGLGTAVGPPLPRRVLIAVGLAVSVPYIFYRPYDHWETLRFLLPIVAVATPLAAVGLHTIVRRAGGAHLSTLLAAVIVGAVAWGWTTWLAANQVFTMPVHEARHRLAGEMVQQTTPASAVIIALQHSGSLRYYSGRQTLNWNGIPAGAFEATVRALRERNLPVYVMIDSEPERALFEQQHGDALERGWLPAGQRRSVQLLEAR